MKKILFVFGTRPEAIKLAPLIKSFHETKNYEIRICSTGQHREMLGQVLNFFSIKPDFDLNLMSPNQSLYDVTSKGLKSLEHVLEEKFDTMIVQGDTTTTFIGSLAAFYKQIPVAHVEAGLRSKNKYSPFPEEINRILTGHIATYHFAPTQKAHKNLLSEGIVDNIHVVGNTGIDALFLCKKMIEENGEAEYYNRFRNVDFSKKIILVTGHRRESFGEPFKNICDALKAISRQFDEVEIIYPVHLNPNIRKPVNDILNNVQRIHLFEPFDYPTMVWLMDRSFFVLTDSGGIQEEAPSLGKPVLVLREVTERTEGIEAGSAKLVGTQSNNIVAQCELLLKNSITYNAMSNAINPYGDGKASARIVQVLS